MGCYSQFAFKIGRIFTDVCKVTRLEMSSFEVLPVDMLLITPAGLGSRFPKLGAPIPANFIPLGGEVKSCLDAHLVNNISQ